MVKFSGGKILLVRGMTNLGFDKPNVFFLSKRVPLMFFYILIIFAALKLAILYSLLK